MTRLVQFVEPTRSSLDSVLSDFKWLVDASSLVVTYAFPTRADDFLIDPELGYDATQSQWDLPYRSGYAGLSALEQSVVEGALAQLSLAVSLSFVRVEDPADAMLKFTATDLSREGVSYLSFAPSPELLPFEVLYDETHVASGIAGDIWLHDDLAGEAFLDALLAGIGIALGQSLPAEDGFTVSGDAPEYGVSTDATTPADSVLSEAEGLNATFMSLDLDALAYLYGESRDRADHLYIVNGSEEDFLEASNLDYGDEYTSIELLNNYLTLDDAGGYNVLVLNIDADLTVDINAGAWSTTSAGAANIFISNDTLIRELVTVDGNDSVIGNAVNNRIFTRGGDDRVAGGAGNDRVFLSSGNDTYVYSAGADTVEGGTGYDTFVLADDSLSGYKFSLEEGVLTITNSLTLETTVATEFEAVTLLGQTVALEDVIESIGELTLLAGLFLDDGDFYRSAIQGDGLVVSSDEAQLYRIYFGSLGRIPDQAGFEFWMEQLEAGSYSLEQISDRFVASEEFIAIADVNGSGNVGAEEFVTHVYTNVFGREPDEAGFDWWVDQLFALEHTQGSAFASMAQSDEFVLLTAATVGDFLFI